MAQYGAIMLDGNLSDWTAAKRLDTGASGVSGYELYGSLENGVYVFAIKATTAITQNTTLWLNVDQNKSTGYQIWGWAGGAEYNVNFGANGAPALYTGGPGQTVSAATLDFFKNADGKIVEFAVAASMLSGGGGALDVLADINDITFLPNSYADYVYTVQAPPPVPGFPAQWDPKLGIHVT